MVRTKSGRMIEKTILVSKAEYEELQRITKEGGDPTKVCLYVPMCSSAYYWLVLLIFLLHTIFQYLCVTKYLSISFFCAMESFCLRI